MSRHKFVPIFCSSFCFYSPLPLILLWPAVPVLLAATEFFALPTFRQLPFSDSANAHEIRIEFQLLCFIFSRPHNFLLIGFHWKSLPAINLLWCRPLPHSLFSRDFCKLVFDLFYICVNVNRVTVTGLLSPLICLFGFRHNETSSPSVPSSSWTNGRQGTEEAETEMTSGNGARRWRCWCWVQMASDSKQVTSCGKGGNVCIIFISIYMYIPQLICYPFGPL